MNEEYKPRVVKINVFNEPDDLIEHLTPSSYTDEDIYDIEDLAPSGEFTDL